MPTEHLVYVAALCVGIPIIFGDRPKNVTYNRLLHGSSLKDLDHAFGVHSASNYVGVLNRLGNSPVVTTKNARIPDSPRSTLHADTVLTEKCETSGPEAISDDNFTRIVINERNRLLQHSFALAMSAHSPQDSSEPAGCVVGVVGGDHLGGIEASWVPKLSENMLTESALAELLRLLAANPRENAQVPFVRASKNQAQGFAGR